MDFHVSFRGRGDLSSQIYRQLLEAVLDGRLRSGERLPPTRELAKRLEVSRNTVAVAYERLTAEGFLTGRVGAGTFVCTEPVARVRSRSAPSGGLRPRRLWETVPEPRPPAEARFDFSVGTPDPRLFPLEIWRRLVSHELHGRGAALLGAGYQDVAGLAGLRAAIARFIGVSRSVRAADDDVIVTRGAQQAFDLIGRVLIEPGDWVAVEEPGYPPVRDLFRALGARVAEVPVDAEGLDVGAIPAAARLVYVTPSHQFPLGTPMSLARRTALLAWLERHGAAVIEDDYDSEFRFSDRPLEPLQSLDHGGRVIYVGSFSKTLLPALRLGFMVAPASLRSALCHAKRLTDWKVEPTAQGALARLIDDGLLARHLRKATRQYAARHELIAGTLRRDFGGLLEPVPAAAGLHLSAKTAPGVDPEAVVAAALRAGVRVESLAGYAARQETAVQGIAIGYGLIGQDHIPEGLRRLAEAFRAAS